MNEFNSLIVGVVSSIVATMLTSLVWLFWNRLKRRDLLFSFLGLNQKEETLICYGNVHKERLLTSGDKIERNYATFEYGDIASILLIYDRLKPMCKAKVKHTVGSDLNIASQGNIVAIGGPKWNKITENLLGKIGSPLYFNQSDLGIVEKRRTHQNENLHTPDSQKQLNGSMRVKDYGFIMCARSYFLGREIPFAMIIAGSSTYGVLIAAEFLVGMKVSLIRLLKKRLKDDERFGLLIEGVVEVDSNGRFVGGEPPKLLTWIPEQDFIDPFSYRYWKE